ncbi:hypothetical protein COJ85_32530 [Bacillus sp. AFS076308]|uniref:hypothetical protein n=1 Tax=unclassified Bacillus (in: firmicutes) TaxID=185979 RepID=UPI000BF88F35|nr:MULTISPECIES: hypothetical protein [unclassified Bacillus (in: firmicutes)]PFN76550.1 hypothetical protein COJ85_32530 [Bacillus sp. AFS076308]PGV54742.1 hypothetical protein COD92_03185 [Bacillus sp. AFS037270]
MRINLSEKQIAEIIRIVQKELLIKGIEPTEEYLFIHCFSKIQKETVYYHLLKENDTLIIRCYARVFDNLGLSEMIRSTAKNVFEYVVDQTGIQNTIYIENGIEFKF